MAAATFSGGRLKFHRTLRGLSRAELARGLHASWHTIYAYEVGRRVPSVKQTVLLAKVLNCSLQDLLHEEA